MDAEGIPLEPDKMKEQPLSAKDERSVSPNASKDAGIGHSKDIADQLGPFGSCGDHHLYPSNIYAPQAQAIYYKGFENAPGEWDEYPAYVNAERLDIGSPGIYNDNPSLLFHTGYGYSPQMPYGPYSPVTTPLPSVGRDAQLYSPQQYPFSGPPYYQHLVPPSMQYITPPTPVSQPVLNSVVSIDQQVDGMLLGPRPSYPSPVTSFGRGNFSGNPGGFGFHDLQQGFDAFRTSGLWSDWSKPSDRQRALTPFSPAVSPQPIGNLGSFGQNVGMSACVRRLKFILCTGGNPSGHIPTHLNQYTTSRGLLSGDIWRRLSSWMPQRETSAQSAEDSNMFPGRGRTLGSSRSQTVSTVSSDSSLEARLLDNGGSPNHPPATGADQQIVNGRQSAFDGATAAAAGVLAHHQGSVSSEEEIQKLVAMGFERTQVEVAVAAADGDLNVAVEILMSQLG